MTKINSLDISPSKNLPSKFLGLFSDNSRTSGATNEGLFGFLGKVGVKKPTEKPAPQIPLVIFTRDDKKPEPENVYKSFKPTLIESAQTLETSVSLLVALEPKQAGFPPEKLGSTKPSELVEKLQISESVVIENHLNYATPVCVNRKTNVISAEVKTHNPYVTPVIKQFVVQRNPVENTLTKHNLSFLNESYTPLLEREKRAIFIQWQSDRKKKLQVVRLHDLVVFLTEFVESRVIKDKKLAVKVLVDSAN